MASPVQYTPGTGGLTVSLLTLATTELNTLTSASVVITSVGGTSGVFTQTNTGNAIWAYIIYKTGGAITPTGAPNISIWEINSNDTGTTFEKNSAAPARPADIVINFNAAALSTNDQIWSPLVRLSPFSNKYLIQNNLGVSTASSGNTITAAIIETQQ